MSEQSLSSAAARANPAVQPAIGEPPAVQFIAVERLEVDPSYQRSTASKASTKLIDSIRRRWDWRLCVPLLVSQRDGKLFIIDGQHRWEGARARGDIAFLPCAVGQYANAGEEAALFVAANRRRVAVNRLDLFRSALAAGEVAALTIERVAKAAGLSVGGSIRAQDLKPGELNCTGALYRGLASVGEERLGGALTILGTAFRGQPIRYAAPLLDAVLKLTGEHGDAAIVRALSLRSADGWVIDPDVVASSGGEGRIWAVLRAVRAAIAAQAVAADQAEKVSKLLPAEVGWCDQCDRRCSGAQVARCASPFCSLKVAA